jgi:hypothetical protein
VDRRGDALHERLRLHPHGPAGAAGLSVTRTDFVPDGARGVLVGLTFRASGGAQRFVLDADAHSELMSIYPWGETEPATQKSFNLNDRVAFDAGAGALVFTEQGRRRSATRPRTTGRPRWAPPCRRRAL